MTASETFPLGDALVVVDHLGNDETEEFLGERRVEPRLLGEGAQPSDLDRFTVRVGRWQFGVFLVAPNGLGDLEPLGEQVYERGIDVVDTGAILIQLQIGLLSPHAVGS